MLDKLNVPKFKQYDLISLNKAVGNLPEYVETTTEDEFLWYADIALKPTPLSITANTNKLIAFWIKPLYS